MFAKSLQLTRQPSSLIFKQQLDTTQSCFTDCAVSKRRSAAVDLGGQNIPAHVLMALPGCSHVQHLRLLYMLTAESCIIISDLLAHLNVHNTCTIRVALSIYRCELTEVECPSKYSVFSNAVTTLYLFSSQNRNL